MIIHYCVLYPAGILCGEECACISTTNALGTKILWFRIIFSSTSRDISYVELILDGVSKSKYSGPKLLVDSNLTPIENEDCDLISDRQKHALQLFTLDWGLDLNDKPFLGHCILDCIWKSALNSALPLWYICYGTNDEYIYFSVKFHSFLKQCCPGL